MTKPRGQRILQSALPEAALNHDEGHNIASIEAQDHLLTEILRRCLSGQRVLVLEPAGKPTSLHLTDLIPDQQTMLQERYSVEGQQSRGAWYHPKKAKLKAGLLNLPFHYAKNERFAMNAVLDEQSSLPLHNPDTTAVWSALEPLAETLFQPLIQTGPEAKKGDRDKRRRTWLTLKAEIQSLGISGEILKTFEANGSWWQLSSTEMRERKSAYLRCLRDISPEEVVRRYRIAQTQALAKRFYQKRRTLNATRERVLTKKLERILSGFFAGDWLEFLTYIEEKPEAGDAVQTELPSPVVVPGLNKEVVDIATNLNLEPSKVQEVAASLFPEVAGVNPIRERLHILEAFWSDFLDLHARQTAGMPSLWGFVHQHERIEIPAAVTSEQAAHSGPPAQYKHHLNRTLQKEIEKFWGTRVVAKYPERLVTNTTPYYWMAQAIGPALEFWEGMFLTAWYITEGPYSRTDIQGMETYYSKHLDRLTKVGTPVNRHIFEELRRAEVRLGPLEYVSNDRNEQEVYPGIVLRTGYGGSERRKGFEMLRDVVLRYARNWTEEYLQSYLETQWKVPLETMSDEVSKRFASKGKPPTVKQFARMAEATANKWFGGDLTAVSVAILQPSPVTQKYEQVISGDVTSLADHIYRKWTKIAQERSLRTDFEDYSDSRPYFQATELTKLSLEYLQLWELLGTRPSHEQFVKQLKFYERDTITRLLAEISDDSEVLWKLFIEVASKPLSIERTVQGDSQVAAVNIDVNEVPQATAARKTFFGWFRNLIGRRGSSEY